MCGKQMTMTDLLLAILQINDIEPNKPTNSGQTAFECLEGTIAGCLDEIED